MARNIVNRMMLMVDSESIESECSDVSDEM